MTINSDSHIVLTPAAGSSVKWGADVLATQAYADQAESDAISISETYTDTAITNLNLGTTYDAYGAAAAAQAAAEQHADAAVAALVGSAPELLDTLQELATALDNDPDAINSLQDIAAGKQDTLTEGANILIQAGIISVTGLDSEDISDFNSAALSATSTAYDLAGSASSAQEAAENYADGLSVNYDVAGAAATAQAAAISYTDGEITDALVTAQGYASTAQTNAQTHTTNAINGLDTDDIEEGATNLYYTNARAEYAAGILLNNATKNNIAIDYSITTGLTITAENGVADSDTDDLVEGTTNKYFTDVRAVDALEAVVPNFTAVELNSVAQQVAATLTAPTAGIQVAHAFSTAAYRSAEYLVKVAYGTHTEISKVLLTLDSSNNIAITEYGIVGTNGSASTISADIDVSVPVAQVRLLVTTANNNSTVTVVGTLVA